MLRLRQVHLLAGGLTVATFLLTGLFLRQQFPAAYAGNESIRYLYRASHLYILLAGLIHLAFGASLARAGGWRRVVQSAGSALLLLALPILLWAFFVEPPRGLPKRPRTLAAVVCLLAGTVLHLAARPEPPPEMR